MANAKQLTFDFVNKRRKDAYNGLLESSYQRLNEMFEGNELLVYDKLTPYCKSYLYKAFNQKAGEQFKIIYSLADSCRPLGLTQIAEYTFTDRRSVSTNLRQLCQKGVLTKQNRKYFFACEPLFKFLVFGRISFGSWLEANPELRTSLKPVTDYIESRLSE